MSTVMVIARQNVKDSVHPLRDPEHTFMMNMSGTLTQGQQWETALAEIYRRYGNDWRVSSVIPE